jgi:hypothetical protein
VCRRSWAEIDDDERFLIHGSLVCPACAETAKGRLLGHFGLLLGAAAFASGMILLKEGATALALFPLATVTGMTAGAVHLMKAANRRAGARIAEGSYDTLGITPPDETDRGILEP